PDVPEPAGPDHDRARAGTEHGQRLLDGVNRSQSRVGEGGDVLRLQRRIELDDRPGAREQEVGETAVSADPWETAVDAVHVVAATAGPAEATGDERVHDHRVADLDVRD